MSDKEKQIPIYRPSKFEDARSWNAGHSQGFKDGRKAAEAENKTLRDGKEKAEILLRWERVILQDWECWEEPDIFDLHEVLENLKEKIDDYFAGKDKADETKTI